MTIRLRTWACAILVGASILAGWFLLAQWGIHGAFGATKHCETEKCYQRALVWEHKLRLHDHLLLVRHERHDAARALRLAAAYSGLPLAKLRCIAWRESRMGAQTTPEPSSHASGLMQFLPSTWARTPFAAYGFSVWDPEANALAAVQIMVHDGSARQWIPTGRECGL